MALADQKPSTVRWKILALLTGFSFVSYVERMNISVAAKFMKPELGLNDIQMGQVFSAFMLGYALFQIPAGVLGDRYGPRKVLTIAALWWGVATVLTGLVPGVILNGAGAVLGTLMVLRFILGVGEAATYPVAGRAIGNWLPVNNRALAQSVMIAGLSIGSAVTPPAVAWLMVHIGWRASFYVTSSVALLVAIAWWLGSTDDPAQHPKVNDAELAILAEARGTAVRPASRDAWWRLIRQRDLFLLSLSYFFNGYVLFIFVFWLYTYLVDVRHFSVLSGGIYASLPFITSAVLTPVGGWAADAMSRRHGTRIGRRVVAMVGLSLGGVCLLYAALAGNAFMAVAGLSLSIAFGQACEGCFWSTAIDLGGPDAGAAGGILNMAGNLGGVASTALMPVVFKQFGWTVALGSGAALAVVAALIWLGVRADGGATAPPPRGSSQDRSDLPSPYISQTADTEIPAG